jgi:hypothetical protein
MSAIIVVERACVTWSVFTTLIFSGCLWNARKILFLIIEGAFCSLSANASALQERNRISYAFYGAGQTTELPPGVRLGNWREGLNEPVKFDRPTE